MGGVSVLTKTYVTLALVGLAIFEFWTAMYLFGQKGPKAGAKWALRLHRIGGYCFLIGWLWPIFVGLDLLERLAKAGPNYQMSPRVFTHALLAVVVLLLLLLKIAFVRVYKNYRMQARLLGFLITLATLTIWLIAGWFWLHIMGAPVLEG